MPRPIRRRDFLKAAAVLGTGVWLGGSTEARPDTPNDKLNLAVIGFGARREESTSMPSAVKTSWPCAMWTMSAPGKAYETFPKAKKFYDFRKMLDDMESQIDGVVIDTPDHTHFHPTRMAMLMGKHVYLEKPMAHSVWETAANRPSWRRKRRWPLS